MPEVVAPRGPLRSGIAPDRPYAVIHAAPMFRYKRWTADGWQVLAAGLDARGLAVIATGGPERSRAISTRSGPGSRRSVALDGGCPGRSLLRCIAGAQVYVGPDTSVTHLAAATGTPTVALYGPTDPRLWGPWPAGGLDQPWDAAGTIQNRGNVWLVQNPPSCPWSILPCQQEGCVRHLNSHSRCLDELPVSQVLSAVDAALAGGRCRLQSAPVAPRARTPVLKG